MEKPGARSPAGLCAAENCSATPATARCRGRRVVTFQRPPNPGSATLPLAVA